MCLFALRLFFFFGGSRVQTQSLPGRSSTAKAIPPAFLTLIIFYSYIGGMTDVHHPLLSFETTILWSPE
jgi:hypothetical protein